ncbi:MAG: hypothetical protein HY820_02410 [Acidobacteria bacterium]|nr:hypothetical protein [Acidobacteriota bacterium]
MSDCRVTIVRDSPKDNQQRQLIVKLDDKHFATLFYGKKATITVPSGPHRLRVDNTFLWKNLPFDIAPGEHITFQLINRSGKLTWWMVSVIGAGPMYISIERQSAEKLS